MKTITIIGSSIAEKVARALSDKVLLKKHYLSINPISFTQEAHDRLPNVAKLNSESYDADINKTVFEELQADTPDYVLIDLLDCRLNILRFTVDGKSYCATNNNGLMEYLKTIPYTVTENRSSHDLSFEEWKEVFNAYYKKLLTIFKPSQIILLKTKSAYTCFSKNDRFYYMLNNRERSVLDSLYERVYSAFIEAAPDVTVIPCPSPLFCDEHETKKFTFALSSIYYAYAADAISYYMEKGSSAKLQLKCDQCSEELKQRVNNREPVENEWKGATLNSFIGSYADDFGNVITNNSLTKVNIILRGTNNHIVIDESCTFNNTTINCIGNNNIQIGERSSFTNVTINCESNNQILIGTGNTFLNTIFAFSSNCKFIIQEKNYLKGVSFVLWDSEVYMGNDNSFYSGNTELRCHSYTKLIINNDTLWSQNIQLVNGDGHSIFDIETKTKINDVSNCSDSKKTIYIGNHVWIGKHATLLRGTHLEDGSVVGANALVTKRFPNNCIISGSPATVKRKNICWCKDNTTFDIEKCNPYIHLTEE